MLLGVVLGHDGWAGGGGGCAEEGVEVAMKGRVVLFQLSGGLEGVCGVVVEPVSWTISLMAETCSEMPFP